MSGWRKFGVALYYSTTLTATAAIGFALFAGFAPFNIIDKNRDVRNWVFIAAAVSLAYITLSALTMFYVLTSKSTKKLNSDPERVTDPITDNLQQKHKVTDDSNQGAKKTIDYVNKVDILDDSVDYLRSKDNKLHTDNYTDLFPELGNEMNSKLKEMEKRDKQLEQEKLNQLRTLQEKTEQLLNSTSINNFGSVQQTVSKQN